MAGLSSLTAERNKLLMMTGSAAFEEAPGL
jgi:hypothetical protein